MVDYRAVMVDMETLGTDLDAAIVSIGAVSFNPYAAEFVVTDSFYEVCSLEEQANRTINYDTICWWMSQSDLVRSSTFNPKVAVSLGEAMANFDLFVLKLQLQEPPDEIWSNGADFDIALLKTIYDDIREEYPWHYKSTRCFRTLKEMYPDVAPPEFPLDGGKHNAKVDAMQQAHWCWKIMQHNGLAAKWRRQQVAEPAELNL